MPAPRNRSSISRAYGLEQLYVADLDAIRGQPANVNAVQTLVDAGFCVAIDAGLDTVAEASRWFDLGVAQVIVGLETLSYLSALDALINAFGAERLRFSLDLRNGIPMTSPLAWGERQGDIATTLEIAQRVIAAGWNRLIVLDLAAVGGRAGPTTAPLCREIRQTFQGLSLWAGGGVQSAADLRQLCDAGADGVLVATALHEQLF